MQIGCDPKHDSTRLLMHGRKITTVLDYIRVTNPLNYKIEDILFHGFGRVGCVEAGGPKPGVGCAGRGIITTFELLDQFRLKEHYDIILYDVLGDVVCGGFAVPIRREYADTIFIVTSGEFMALYAANNILRGIRNYDNEEKRVAGILYNRRNVEGEDLRVERFAQAVGLKVCAVVPRSDAFTRAEQENMTVVEQGACGDVKDIFTELAQGIIDGVELYEAKPLSDEQLELVVLGIKKEASTPAADTAILGTPAEPAPTAGAEINLSDPNRYLSKNIIRNEPLHGCAFNGAVTMSIHIRDAVILAHSPKSCAYISYQSISSAGRRGLFERGALLPFAISPNLESTEMGEAEMIFGGMEKLENKLRAIKHQRPKAIIVVSAPSGIIGDDIDRMKLLSEPDLPVVTIKADGNMAGDYLQGMLMCYTSLAKQIIDGMCRVEVSLPSLGYVDVIPKTHLGIQGALMLTEQIINSLLF